MTVLNAMDNKIRFKLRIKVAELVQTVITKTSRLHKKSLKNMAANILTYLFKSSLLLFLFKLHGLTNLNKLQSNKENKVAILT